MVGLLIATGTGPGSAPGAGPGWMMRPGASHHITTDAGSTLATGPGYPDLCMCVRYTLLPWWRGLAVITSQSASRSEAAMDGARSVTANPISPGTGAVAVTSRT